MAVDAGSFSWVQPGVAPMMVRACRRNAACTSIVVAAIAMIGGCGENTAPTSKPSGAVLRVVTSTTGGDPDDDGYKIIVDDKRTVLVGIDRVAFFDSVSVGSHTVALEGVANNCDPVQSRSVDITAGDTVTVFFDIKCEATGVEVSSQTSGPDYGPYQVSIGGRVGYAPANGILVLTRLAPGTQTLSLTEVPTFCQLVGNQSTTVQVTNRKIAHVPIRLVCGASDKVLAFVLDDFRGGLIVVARTDGTAGDTLVKGRTPAWAPDGGKLMYSNAECLSYGYYDDDVRCFGGLFMLNPDSRVSTAVTRGENGQDPAWNPDGKSIVFSKIDKTFSDPAKLYILKLDGSSFPVELKTPPATDAKHPAWSPDGKRIAFQCYTTGSDGFTHNEICVINADGTRFTQLTAEQGYNYSLRPAWSPDGKHIAFATSRFAKIGDQNPTSIAIMSSDGGEVTRIATGDSPAWSPDGSRLVFNTVDGLFMSNPDGSALARITNGRHRYPAWRPPVGDGGPSPWDY